MPLRAFRLPRRGSARIGLGCFGRRMEIGSPSLPISRTACHGSVSAPGQRGAGAGRRRLRASEPERGLACRLHKQSLSVPCRRKIQLYCNSDRAKRVEPLVRWVVGRKAVLRGSPCVFLFSYAERVVRKDPMRRTASPHPRVSLARALGALSVLAFGSVVASSCLTPDFEFAPEARVMGGSSQYPVHCDNGALDGDETALDCGGSCKGCGLGQACVVPRDCESPPLEDASYVLCNAAGLCELDCPRDKGDCDSLAINGCEADFLTDAEHCGGCRIECDLAHAAEQCMNGACRIKTDLPNQGCDPDYANCDLMDDNGCEVNLQTDEAHCGQCEDSACPAQNGEPSCTRGQCAIVCDEGFEDCDDNARVNGCEVNVYANVNHCGQCSHICTTDGEEYSAYCREGECGQTLCPTGLGDCDGDTVCEDRLDTIANCGQCGAECAVSNGRPACQADEELGVMCVIDTCDQSEDAAWANCDGEYATGCEVNTLSTRTRCGGCLPSEGGSGEDCSVKEGTDHVTVTSCSSGACQIVSCETGWVDCDGAFANGCETNTSSDENNCGGCAAHGGDVCVDKPNTGGQCTAGSCVYSCHPGWSDLNNDRYDETGSDGCESRTLELVGEGAFASFDTGANGGEPLVIEHTLVRAAGTQRLILVGVLCRGNSAANCAIEYVRYGSAELTLLNEVFLTDSAVKIYYALDSTLPAPGTYSVSIKRNNDWGSLAAEVTEWNGAEQDTFYADHAVAVDDFNCNNSAGPSLTLEELPRGSIVYAVGGAQPEARAEQPTFSLLS